MSGSNDGIISILKTNQMFHNKAIGLIIGNGNLLDLLYQRYGLPVTGLVEENTRYDYIFLSKENVNSRKLLRTLSKANIGGIIILELNENSDKFEDRYTSLFAGFTATKVTYGNKIYLVIHSGVDYAD